MWISHEPRLWQQQENDVRSMHGTVTYSAGSLGLWRTKLLFGFVRNGVGLSARASDVVASEWEMPL